MFFSIYMYISILHLRDGLTLHYYMFILFALVRVPLQDLMITTFY